MGIMIPETCEIGIMVPETCWDRSLTINIRLVKSYWFLSLSSPYLKMLIREFIFALECSWNCDSLFCAQIEILRFAVVWCYSFMLDQGCLSNCSNVILWIRLCIIICIFTLYPVIFRRQDFSANESLFSYRIKPSLCTEAVVCIHSNTFLCPVPITHKIQWKLQYVPLGELENYITWCNFILCNVS